jgi:carbon-monoxide dehydrogenase medium subunit
MWREYITVKSLDEAVELIGESPEDTRIIAGATDLMLELENKIHPQIHRLIDITRIPAVDGITIDDGWIHLGPLVTHNHCASSQLVQDHAFALAKACWEVGSPQIRNRGTIVGNLITASPANDSIPPLMALGAEINLKSTESERSVPLDQFYRGVRQTMLNPSEVVTGVAFPVPGINTRSTFIKVALRRAQAIAVVNLAAVIKFDGPQVIDAKITMGSVAPTVIHVNSAEKFLVGKSITTEVATEAGDIASSDAQPIDDLRGSADYRREMIRVSVRRALLALAEGSERDGFPEKQVKLWGKHEGRWQEELAAPFEHHDKEEIDTTINGKRYQFATGQNKSLLRLLREEAQLTGSKEGCAEGECGACTVFLDDMAVMACLVPAPRAHQANIITIEDLAKDDHLHPLQETFISEGAVQCGYCTPGFIMSGVKLLEEIPHPSKDEIEQSITGNLCRCTGYYKTVTAFEQAAARNA